MATTSIRARQQLRNAQNVDHWMAQLLTLLKDDAASGRLQEFGLTRRSPPAGMAPELCIASHLKDLVTQRDHVVYNTESASIIHGRVRLRDLIDGKPGGRCYMSMIVRADGYISFDGTVDMEYPLEEVHGYHDQICHTFAERVLIAVHDSLDVIG
jgi:hypothetical protein